MAGYLAIPATVAQPAPTQTAVIVADLSAAPEAAASAPTAPHSSISKENASWMSLGVFRLADASSTAQPTRMMELAVSRDGVIRGTHLDLLGDSVAPVTGRVDKNTARASWSIGETGRVRFEARVLDLAEPEATVTLLDEEGRNERWTLTKVASPED